MCQTLSPVQGGALVTKTKMIFVLIEKRDNTEGNI